MKSMNTLRALFLITLIVALSSPTLAGDTEVAKQAGVVETIVELVEATLAALLAPFGSLTAPFGG